MAATRLSTPEIISITIMVVTLLVTIMVIDHMETRASVAKNFPAVCANHGGQSVLLTSGTVTCIKDGK